MSWVIHSSNYAFPLSPTGHSHQLFHVCGIIATHFQMQAIEMDMTLRRPWLHDHGPDITFRGTLGATMLSTVISLGIICLFSYPLFQSPFWGKATREGSGAAKKKWGHQLELSECSLEVWTWTNGELQQEECFGLMHKKMHKRFSHFWKVKE